MVKQNKRFGRPIPEWIEDKPELGIGLAFFLDSFWDLNTERFIGRITQQLSWSCIEKYCRYYDLDYEEREDFFYFIRRLDNAYIELRSKK